MRGGGHLCVLRVGPLSQSLRLRRKRVRDNGLTDASWFFGWAPSKPSADFMGPIRWTSQSPCHPNQSITSMQIRLLSTIADRTCRKGGRETSDRWEASQFVVGDLWPRSVEDWVVPRGGSRKLSVLHRRLRPGITTPWTDTTPPRCVIRASVVLTQGMETTSKPAFVPSSCSTS
jgi:hypothetical protein